MTEKKIVLVEVDPASPITKAISYSSGRKAFFKAVTYVCADGTRLPSSVHSERKKDLPRRIEREQQSAKAGGLTACFDDFGKFNMTISKWVCASGGLVPDTATDPIQSSLTPAGI